MLDIVLAALLAAGGGSYGDTPQPPSPDPDSPNPDLPWGDQPPLRTNDDVIVITNGNNPFDQECLPSDGCTIPYVSYCTTDCPPFP